MISFVYLDVGGVVVKDFSASNKWDLLRKDLGILNGDKNLFDNIWRNYEREICTIKPVDEMILILEKEFHITIEDKYSLLDTFVKYFEKNESIFPLLKEIKNHSRIGLLTNMYVGMFDKILAANILPAVSWDIIIDSSIVGYAKPDKQIFEIAQVKANVPSQEILFVDNSKRNIIAAQELGWQTFFYDSSDYENSSKKLWNFFEEQYKS